MSMHISSESFKEHMRYKLALNKAKPEDILIDGKPIDPDLLAEWEFIGLNNVDVVKYII